MGRGGARNDKKGGEEMIEALETILSGLVLGLSLAAPPGPVNAVIAFEGSRKAVRGTLVGLGAMTSDFIYMLIVLYLGIFIPNYVKKYLFVIGGLIMVFLVWLIWRAGTETKEGSGSYTPYIKGLTMGLTNPYQMGWWVTAGLSSINLFGPIFVVGFFLGISLWITAFPLAINKGASTMGKKFVYLIKVFSMIVLLGFAAYFIYSYFTL